MMGYRRIPLQSTSLWQGTLGAERFSDAWYRGVARKASALSLVPKDNTGDIGCSGLVQTKRNSVTLVRLTL